MIKIILLVVVMALPERGVCSRSNLVNMTLVRRARSLGAYCLDGSLPAYHLDRGFGSGTRNWLLQFEGGGWCNDVESCMERSQTRRGSTRYMGKQEVFSGILSNNASLFLEDTLRAAELPDMWVAWIMKCVTTTSMRVLWNGEVTQSFKPSRGIRQGDPLSPYLFVLCMERLNHMIERLVNEGSWKPIRASRQGPWISHLFFADDLLLFAEASVEQVTTIKNCLQTFCDASGQKISLEKSKLCVSKNVSGLLAERLSRESGIELTSDLGKYLGMPVLHKRLNKHTFNGLIEQVENKLNGWRGRLLNMAGRVTLARSVLNAIPTHTMSTMLIPSSTCERLDRISRDFIWGSYAGSRRVHLVNWDMICKPRKDGGLSIRAAKNSNLALIGKLGWRVLHNPSELWAKILIKKYKIGTGNAREMIAERKKGSPVWRSILTGLKEVVAPGLRWNVFSGADTNFWKDKWILDKPLMEYVVTPNLINTMDQTVRYFWAPDEGWKWELLATSLPNTVLLSLASIALNPDPSIKDVLSWGPSKNGVYTVAEAYRSLVGPSTLNHMMKSIYKLIWRVHVPEKINNFLWLVTKGRILTNLERYRRHIAPDPTCTLCQAEPESLLHLLRDCHRIKQIFTASCFWVKTDFYNWNRVKLRYCDGASFTGNSYFLNGTSLLYFRGQRIWEALILDLLPKGLRFANKAMLSGCSAGGLAVFHHCDSLASFLPSNATVKCLSDAGFFLDIRDITRNHTMRSFYDQLIELQGVEQNLNPNCTSSLDFPNLCFFPQYALPYIRTPFFILNSAYDIFQFHHALVPPSADPHGHWKHCWFNVTACSPIQIEVLQGLRVNMVLAMLPFYTNSTRGGVFIDSCFAHCQSELQDTWYTLDSPTVHNKTISEAVGDWFFSRRKTKLIDRPYPCDTNCRNLI